MGVKKLLAQRYAGFISLDEVLNQIAESSGVGYQEAATALHILLWEELDSPIWRSKERLYGISDASLAEQELAYKTLSNIATFGYPDDQLPF